MFGHSSDFIILKIPRKIEQNQQKSILCSTQSQRKRKEIITVYQLNWKRGCQTFWHPKFDNYHFRTRVAETAEVF